MIFNPIIRKEVLMSLRTSKALAMQAMFLLALGALLWLNWPADGMQDVGGQKAREILSILAIGGLAMVALFAPTFTAAALTGEKERRTLDSLFATRLRPWELGLGKMVGSLAFLMLVVLSGSLALAAPLLLGGIGGGEVVAVMGLLLLTAVYLGAIGLLVSTMMHRSYRAIIVTYSILLVVLFILATPAWPVSGHLITRGGPVWQGMLHVISSFSPLEAMLSLVGPAEYAKGAHDWPPFWQVHIPLALTVIVVVAIVCIAKLSRPTPPPRPREKLKVVERGQFTARSVLFLIDPRKRKQMIRWYQNPILIKEFRTRPMLQPHRLIRAAGLCLILSIVLMVVVNFSVMSLVGEGGVDVQTDSSGSTQQQLSTIPAIATAVAVLMVVMIVLIGPAMSSGAISSDRETGVWELLRATRMSSWRIASGKFQASIIPLALLVLATAPALVILLAIDSTVLPNVLRILAVVGVTVLFVSAAGMFFSSLFARTSTATAWTYGVVIGMGLLSLLMLLGDNRFPQRLKETVFVLNPVAAVMAAAGNASMQQYDLFGPYVRITLMASMTLFVVTAARIFQLRRPEV